MIQVNYYPPESVEDRLLRFVVTAARYEDKWVFSRHKERSTWDMPGGHRELGESVTDAMHRELWEETGATDATITPVFAYSVTKEGQTTYGMLFYSEIHTLDQLPGEYEMAEVIQMDRLPEELTYPAIQPQLFSWIQGWLNMQSNSGELWDIYDEKRNLTGKLHRRGDYLPQGCYHLVVHVWMVNREGKFLITKRSANKGFPNMWESTGGSALAGDDSLTAALREVREETGLILDSAKGTRVMTARKADYFRDVWLFRQDFDLEDVVLQPGETVDKDYAGKDQILQLLKDGDFVPYDYIEELFQLTCL